ncbi:hypothetical protein E4U55_003654 [Claviceps digitariae]|nr:hypothetical protein E4U55_003654 [Claviceps digitariae]
MASQPDSKASIIRVSINGGTVLGKRQPSSDAYPRPVDIFYGIPYATAARFQRAKPCVPVERGCVLDARSECPYVPQPLAPFDTEEGILRLNVFRTAREDARAGEEQSLLPVVVYLHGGAFNFGHPLERDLASLVSWSGVDMVVVAVGYRLGVLGFPGEALGEELNLGLRDQRMGAEWVGEWIGRFGGDGGDVTMMGVSAGGHSIGHHLLHPSRLPFHKAILESGSPTARSVLSPSHPRVKAQHEAFTRVIRARIPPDSSIAAAPLAAILHAWKSVWQAHTDAVTWPFQPLIDGDLIPATPLSSWEGFPSASACSSPVSVMTGFCTHEGTQFVPKAAATNAEFLAFFKMLIPGLSEADLSELAELYPDPVTDPLSPYKNLDQQRQQQQQQQQQQQSTDTRPGAQFRRLYSAYGHYAYTCPILHTAHVLSSKGHRVYLYEYAPLGGPFNTCSHGDQLPVVAHQMDLLADKPGLVRTAREMTLRWSRFVGSPAGEMDDELWPRFGGARPEQQQVLVFGDGNDEMAGGTAEGRPVGVRRNE